MHAPYPFEYQCPHLWHENDRLGIVIKMIVIAALILQRSIVRIRYDDVGVLYTPAYSAIKG